MTIARGTNNRFQLLIKINHQSPRAQQFELSPSWERVLSRISGPSDTLDGPDFIEMATIPSVILVRGPKRTGKSTFARVLCNRLTTTYRRVGYLECDLAHAEFTPPGMVALNILEHPLFG